MKKYNELVDLALKKGWKPTWGTQPKLGKNWTEEEMLLKLTSMQRWLRDIQNCHITVTHLIGVAKKDEYGCIIQSRKGVNFSKRFAKYEDALFDGVKIAFHTLKDYWIEVGTS